MIHSLTTALFLATMLAYLGASVVLVAKVGGRKVSDGVVTYTRRALTLGAILHLVHVVLWSVVLGVCPVDGLYFPLSFAANLLVWAFLALSRRGRLEALGSVVAPLALTALLASRFAMQATAPSEAVTGALLPFHITANLLGVALFSLAAAAALLYLMQERRLKAKKLMSINRLPALDVLDAALSRMLVAGFPLLTIGVVTGSLFLHRLHGESPWVLVRSSLGYVIWLLIATVLVLRQAFGWRGRRAALGTLAGFGLTVTLLAFYALRGTNG